MNVAFMELPLILDFAFLVCHELDMILGYYQKHSPEEFGVFAILEVWDLEGFH